MVHPKGIQSYFVEMGFMRNPSIESLVIDSCGVNSLSTISKSDESNFICNQDFPIEALRRSVFESHNNSMTLIVELLPATTDQASMSPTRALN